MASRSPLETLPVLKWASSGVKVGQYVNGWRRAEAEHQLAGRCHWWGGWSMRSCQGLAQLAATVAAAKKSVGRRRSRRQVIAMGRSPACCT